MSDAELGAVLASARRELTPISDTPSLDAQLLMMRTLGVPRAWVLAHPEAVLEEEQLASFRRFLRQYREGMALPHVLGRWEFFGRQFHLSPAVMVPRPETEHLVEGALRLLEDREDLRRVLDVGTGSGCIVVSLALEFPNRTYFASDIDRGSLEVAGRNLREYRLEGSVHLVQAHALQGLRGPFDMVVANLPYIPSSKVDQLTVGEREPRRALDGGADGLEALRVLAGGLRRSLRPGGELLLELDPGQMTAAQAILQEAIALEGVRIYRDLPGRDRVLHARRDPQRGEGQ